MNELDPIARPGLFDEAAWDALSPGERVRTLRSAQDQVALPVPTYQALRRLPSWAFYGPEHGLPAEMFNQQGFLLPRYRPGGPDHERFELWRRAHRRRRWIAERLWERWWVRWREREPWLALLGVALVFLIGVSVRVWLERRGSAEEAVGAWMWLVWPALWIVVGLGALAVRAWLLPTLGGLVVERIVRQREQRRGGRE